MTTTETPNTTNGGQTARTEIGSAGTDLDGLLNEFESPKPVTQPRPDISVLKAIKPVIDYVDTEMKTKAKTALDEDIKKAVSFVKEDESVKALPDKIVRGFLEGHAAEDPSFAQAFQNRQADPNTWQAKLADARKAFSEEVKGLPGNMVKSDVEAARAAVAGSRSEPVGDKQPSAVELSRMSQREFDNYWKQIAANSKR